MGQCCSRKQEVQELIMENEQQKQDLTKENEHQKQDLIKENEQQKQDLIKENEQQQKQDIEERIAPLQQEKVGMKLAEEEEQQIMLPVHEMKVQLPLENWYDFLSLVPRHQLVNIASENGDRQFTPILQSFLHEHGNITLRRMEIGLPQWSDAVDRDTIPLAAVLEWEYNSGRYVITKKWKYEDLPDWPMPDNIKSFNRITLEYFDMRVFNFLQYFQKNSLLANVHLDLSYGPHTLPALNKILPLISSIPSINFRDDLSGWVHNKDETSQRLLKTMMAQTRILSMIYWHSKDSKCTLKDKIDWCLSWLYTPREDGIARALLSDDIEEPHYSSFIDRIKKDFLEADHAVNFFIRLNVPENFQLKISLNNEKTNEKLVVKAEAGFYDEQKLLLSRHSSKAAKQKIEEDEKKILQWNQYIGPPRRISLSQSMSVGM